MYTDPYLLAPTAGAIDIVWLTPVPTEKSWVEYGETAQYGALATAKTYEIEGLKAEDPGVYQQFAHIDGLKEGTRYYYRVVSESGGFRSISGGFSFRTAPKPGTPLKFLILSDLQLMPRASASLKIAGQQGADFIIYNGDFVFEPHKADEWLRLFAMFQQTEDNCRLLQYIPIFPCPGNHEITDQNVLKDKGLARLESLDLRVYMQLFRSYYPEEQYEANGKHWYSVDFGDLHIVSLSAVRWFSFPPTEAPGWFLFDGISAGSPQYNWLKADLEAKEAKYTWVSQHWHMFNRGKDTQFAFTDPVASPTDPDQMEYPREKDYIHRDIKPLFEEYGVDAVSFGHSHVYERYFVNGIHYIEAASGGNCYRGADDPDDPYGYKPVVEDNRFRSIMVVSADPEKGLRAQGIQTSDENGVGYIGRVFDDFQIAPAR